MRYSKSSTPSLGNTLIILLLCFVLCSFSGPHNQMWLVGTVKRIVIFLSVLEQFSLEKQTNQQLSQFAKFTCICFASNNFFSVMPFFLDMSFVVRSHIFKRKLNMHKLFLKQLTME
jgi:hypothetical protein